MFNHKQRGCLIPDKGIRSPRGDKLTRSFNKLKYNNLEKQKQPILPNSGLLGLLEKATEVAPFWRRFILKWHLMPQSTPAAEATPRDRERAP